MSVAGRVGLSAVTVVGLDVAVCAASAGVGAVSKERDGSLWAVDHAQTEDTRWGRVVAATTIGERSNSVASKACHGWRQRAAPRVVGAASGDLHGRCRRRDRWSQHNNPLIRRWLAVHQRPEHVRIALG